MNGLEFVTISVFIVSYIVVLMVGVSIGAVMMACHIQRELHRAHDHIARKLLAPPPPDGDEWKQRTEDDKWMREQIDGKQKDNDTEKT